MTDYKKAWEDSVKYAHKLEIENEKLEERRLRWWRLACGRFAAITKVREILVNIEESPFRNEKEVDGAIQEAYDILDEAIRNAKEKR